MGNPNPYNSTIHAEVEFDVKIILLCFGKRPMEDLRIIGQQNRYIYKEPYYATAMVVKSRTQWNKQISKAITPHHAKSDHITRRTALQIQTPSQKFATYRIEKHFPKEDSSGYKLHILNLCLKGLKK